MKSGVLAFALVPLFLAVLWVRADNPPNYALDPAADITLYRGEKIELQVLDTRTNKPVEASRIAWQIDGQPAAALPISQGSFTPASDGGAAVYRTPLRKPQHSTMSLSAAITDPGGVQTINGFLTVTDQRNWFAIDGDTGMGPQSVSIELAPDKPSFAGTAANPFLSGPGEFTVRINGSRLEKDHGGNVALEMTLGASGAPGTYAWNSGKHRVGMSVMMMRDRKEYLSLDFGVRDLSSTAGSITIMQPRSIDPPGQVKGFFSGRLCWPDMYRRAFPHYCTIRGHFAVQGKGPATAPAATASPPAAASPASR